MRNDLSAALSGLFSADLLTGITKRQGEILTRSARVDSADYDYQVYVPADTRDSRKLPVIVFLHGIRERGSGGLIAADGAAGKILKQYLKRIPAIVVLPQCRPGKYWSDAAMDAMVMRAVKQTVEEFDADAERLYLVGVSMGGYGVWHFAARHPGRFAALVSICGGSPFLEGDRFNPLAEKVGKTPAWLFHGAADEIVPVSESRQIVRAIERARGSVRYSKYAGVGHNVWLNALAEKDLLPWLLRQNSGNRPAFAVS